MNAVAALEFSKLLEGILKNLLASVKKYSYKLMCESWKTLESFLKIHSRSWQFFPAMWFRVPIRGYKAKKEKKQFRKSFPWKPKDSKFFLI